MRNKSLIFLALIVLGITGCNKETASTDAAKETTGNVSVVADQQNKEAQAPAAVTDNKEAQAPAVVPAPTAVPDNKEAQAPAVVPASTDASSQPNTSTSK